MIGATKALGGKAFAATTLLLAGMVMLTWSAYIPVKAAVAQVLLQNAWNRSLDGPSVQKPWPWADTWPVAKISAPRLGRSAIVLHGASGEAMAFGPGHMSQTPAIGAPGTAVIAAHRDTHFRFLKDLQQGDTIEVATRNGAVRNYAVTTMRIVRADASGVNPQLAGTTGTSIALVTCYPFDTITRGPLRYVVFADLVPEPAEPNLAGTP